MSHLFEVFLQFSIAILITKNISACKKDHLDCYLLEKCPHVPKTIEEFVKSLSLVKGSRGEKHANLSYDDCIKYHIRCYLMNLSDRMKAEIDLKMTKNRTLHKITHPILNVLDDNEECECGHQRIPYIELSITKVFTGGKIESSLAKLKYQDEKSLSYHIFNYMADLFENYTSTDLLSMPDDKIDGIIKQIFYENIIRDICLNSIHLLYEQIVSSLDIIFKSEYKRFKPIVEDISQNNLLINNVYLREAYLETTLCKYVRSATASAIRDENGVLSVKIYSLESFESLLRLLFERLDID